jgi:sphingolipid delta-4 desaturase
MGHTRTTKYLVLFVVTLQLSLSILLSTRQIHPLSWKFLLTAYVVGGTANQNLFLAIHEISHNMAFRRIWMNRILAMVANLGIGVPYSVVFKVRPSRLPLLTFPRSPSLFLLSFVRWAEKRFGSCPLWGLV